MNVILHITVKSGETSTDYFNDRYCMPPDLEECYKDVNLFEKGRKLQVSDTAKEAYWLFLNALAKDNFGEPLPGYPISAGMIPDIPYKFDRKRQVGIIETEEYTVEFWLSIQN